MARKQTRNMSAERLSFVEWKMHVDNVLYYRCMFLSAQLPDIDYWQRYQDGYSPEQAAEDCLANLMEITGVRR